MYAPDGTLKSPNALPGLAELEGLRVGRFGGKINMGIGGINGVVISRVWAFTPTLRQMAAILKITVAELRERLGAVRAMPFRSWLRTSQRPSPKVLTRGMPRGQPYWTVLMSSPMMGSPASQKRRAQAGSEAMNTGMAFTNPTPASSAHSA